MLPYDKNGTITGSLIPGGTYGPNVSYIPGPMFGYSPPSAADNSSSSTTVDTVVVTAQRPSCGFFCTVGRILAPIGVALGLEVVGAGPVDVPMDAVAVGEVVSGEAAVAKDVELVGGAQSALAGPALSRQLTSEMASSAFAADGGLSDEALAGAREIIPGSDLGNPAIPDGFSKFSTDTFPSPSGDFQTHFYMNPTTGELWYGADYKSLFTNGGPGS